MLEVHGLIKNYGMKEVLRGLDLTAETGGVYGLVGRNGAGKTTLLQIVAGVIPFSSGNVMINGISIFSKEVPSVALILDVPELYPYLTASEYLAFVASGTPDSPQRIRERSAELLRLVGLEGAENTRIGAMSRGMRQRFGIAAGIYSDPNVVLMDEPCSALDPRGRHEVNEVIRSLAASGKTVLLSTHILSDVEHLCTRVGILTGGRISFEGSLEDLARRYAAPTYEIISSDNARLMEILTDGYILGKTISENRLFVTIDDHGDHARRLLASIVQSGVEVEKFARRTVSLEEIFLREDSAL